MDWTITRIDAFDVDIPLHSPFGIAGGAQHVAANVLVRVALASGAEGWGEAAPFPAANGETRADARSGIAGCGWVGRDARAWRPLSAGLVASGSARCALETALVDALCTAWGVPLWAFFGGAGTSLVTDVTITTGTADEAALAASRLAAEGVTILKIKVGGVPLAVDADRLRRIHAAAPGCGLLLDANASLPDPSAALAILDAARAAGARVVLFEQPLGRHDLAGMAALRRDAACPIAVDESVGSVADVLAIARAGAADVINVKATKSGLVGAHDLALAAKAHGLGRMIGAMVESPLALTASACLAAGMGGFEFVDLDTHRWLRDPPVRGGFVERGPTLDLAGIPAGHGVRPLRGIAEVS
jgi:L-alanine-DL-glutamate epimerase-like enolase superfamily enzyme